MNKLTIIVISFMLSICSADHTYFVSYIFDNGYGNNSISVSNNITYEDIEAFSEIIKEQDPEIKGNVVVMCIEELK